MKRRSLCVDRSSNWHLNRDFDRYFHHPFDGHGLFGKLFERFCTFPARFPKLAERFSI